MFSEDRDELLTVAVEFCLNATRSDAQAVIEAWSEDAKTKVARSIEHAIKSASGAKDDEIKIVACRNDKTRDGFTIEEIGSLPYGYTIKLVDRDA